MTMHDDPDLTVLERDLSKLAEPREDDERIRLAVRRQLVAGSRPRPRRRLSVRMAFWLAGATAAAAAVAIVALAGTSGSGGPAVADAAIIHHAINAVTPPANEILHVKVVGVQNGVRVAAETWQETTAPYALRAVKGDIANQDEMFDDGTTSFQYDPATNTISEQRDTAPPRFADPISQVRQELATGQAQVAGTVVIGGSALYKIDLPHGLIGYFDTSDYRPRYLDDPQRDGTVVRLRVVAYGYLPMTSANRALLSVTAQHPGARIVSGSNAEPAK